MSNAYERQVAQEWDRADFNDFSDDYLDWCEENEREPEPDHYDEWLDDKAAERQLDWLREQRLYNYN